MNKISYITALIKTKYFSICDLKVVSASPTCGIMYLTKNSPHFISCQVRLKGKDNGLMLMHKQLAKLYSSR